MVNTLRATALGEGTGETLRIFFPEDQNTWLYKECRGVAEDARKTLEEEPSYTIVIEKPGAYTELQEELNTKLSNLSEITVVRTETGFFLYGCLAAAQKTTGTAKLGSDDTHVESGVAKGSTSWFSGWGKKSKSKPLTLKEHAAIRAKQSGEPESEPENAPPPSEIASNELKKLFNRR